MYQNGQNSIDLFQTAVFLHIGYQCSLYCSVYVWLVTQYNLYQLYQTCCSYYSGMLDNQSTVGDSH